MHFISELPPRCLKGMCHLESSPVVAASRETTPSSNSSVVGQRNDQEYSFNNALQLALPSTANLQSIHPLDGHLHCLRLLILCNGAQLFFKRSPTPTTPLLRRECFLLETEARVLALLGPRLNSYIPQLYYYNHQPGSTFFIRQYITGTTLQDVEAQLSVQQRQNIDQHLGSLANTIGQHTAPSFGPLKQVISGLGKHSWRAAFITLFEEALRDAEDAFVHLPYTDIRHQLGRLAPALDEITVPRLFVVDFGQASHVLLVPGSKKLSGIVDFGNALWGDVFMAEVFDYPSPALLEGFGLIWPMQSKLGNIRQLLYAFCIPFFKDYLLMVGFLGICATDLSTRSRFSFTGRETSLSKLMRGDN